MQGSVTPHVPKSHTPFQWARMYPLDVIEERVNLPAQGAALEGRGLQDRQPQVAARAGRAGARRPPPERRAGRHGQASATPTGSAPWTRPGLTEDFYARERPLDELFPWSHIEEGVSDPRPGICSGSAPPARPPATRRARSWATPSATCWSSTKPATRTRSAPRGSRQLSGVGDSFSPPAVGRLRAELRPAQNLRSVIGKPPLLGGLFT